MHYLWLSPGSEKRRYTFETYFILKLFLKTENLLAKQHVSHIENLYVSHELSHDGKKRGY